MLPALGICAGVGVEGQADGNRCLRMRGQQDEEQCCPGAGPAGRHGAPQGQAAWLGSHVFECLGAVQVHTRESDEQMVALID